MKRLVKIIHGRTALETETKVNEFLNELSEKSHVQSLTVQRNDGIFIATIFYYVEDNKKKVNYVEDVCLSVDGQSTVTYKLPQCPSCLGYPTYDLEYCPYCGQELEY